MTNTTISINTHKLKVMVTNDLRTKEKIVATVQDLLRQKESLATFSLAGLDKLFKGETPKRYTSEILEALAEVLGADLSSFAELEQKAS